MTDASDFVEDFLSHKYDPVKRREYYLRTRKLKGRKPSAGREARLKASMDRWKRAKKRAEAMPPGPARTRTLTRLKPLETKLFNEWTKLSKDMSKNKQRERNI